MKKKRIHFVGIKGVGMTPLAIIAKEAGCDVTGCDIDEEFITDKSLKKAGINPLIDFSIDHVLDCDIVVSTGAHGGMENEEVKHAIKLGKKVILQGQAVGLYMDGDLFEKKYIKGISVLGAHGKTTTTAMIATIFMHAKKDPSYLVGTSDILSLGNAGHYGKGQYFIAEADEYINDSDLEKRAKFLWQHPEIAIITNIEFDHPDVYSTIEDVITSFTSFISGIKAGGLLIGHGDDPIVKKLLKEFNGRSIIYGIGTQNDFLLSRVSVHDGRTYFWVDSSGVSLGEFMIQVIGEHNALNALAAIICSIEAGISVETIKKALNQFSGTKRRFEFQGKLKSGAFLYDDYAHHPTEIKKTLEACRQNFPKLKIICIFQPHTFSRTKKLFNDFIHIFQIVDTLILTDIFSSGREKNDGTVSSRDIYQEMTRFYSNIIYLPSLSNVIEYLEKKQYGKDVIIITMGAGDVYKIQKNLMME